MIDKLGKYEVRRELGRGAMGVVYEAWDPMIKRTVAVKTIRADALARDEAAELVARFRREAQAAGRLNHPNIVAIYDFDEIDGTSFIAMEYVAGRELREMFSAQERFSVGDAVRIMGQILDALDYSHWQGVVHRDVKPANVFVLADGTVKVADFGIAHIETSSLTHAGSVMGTPGYMSPEQILGLPVDGRSDLFSAGVILYQFLTGERPFAASAPTTVMQKVLKEDPLPPSTLNVQLPDAVDVVLQKALAKKPDERYATASEFAQALRTAVGPRATATSPRVAVAGAAAAGAATSTAEPTLVAAHAAAPDATTVVPQAGATAPAQDRAPGAPSRRPSSAVLAVVGGLAVMAFAVAAWFLLLREGPGDGATRVATAKGDVATASRAVEKAPATPSQEAAGRAAAASTAPESAAPQPPPATSPPPAAPAAPVEPGRVVVTALGLADPAHPRYQGDVTKAAADARADARSQVVAKALGLLVERESLSRHYEVLSQRLMAPGTTFVGPVVRESEPRTGKDGFVSTTTEAVVDVKALQKSLNRMTREERLSLIRAGGDPRIALRVRVRDADRPDAPVRAAPAAENLLKERIRSFGFRTMSDEPGKSGRRADFLVTADATVRTVSTRLEASGITISKVAVVSMSVKAVDTASSEEIYFNTAIPKGAGTYTTEDEALAALGQRIADEFSRDLFLQHLDARPRRVVLAVKGWPEAASAALSRELVALPGVIAVRPQAGGRDFDLDVAGQGAPGDVMARDVVGPINAKLGTPCLALGATAGDRVEVAFDARCTEPGVLARLESDPPAGLYGAPASRKRTLVANPETLRKLSL